MLVKIRNNATGEVRQIDDSQLGNFGLGASATPTPPDTQSVDQQPAPQQPQGGGIIDTLLNTFIPQTKKYATEEIGKFQQAEANRPKDILGGALKDFGALSMVLGDAVKPALETGSLVAAGAGGKAVEGAGAVTKILAGTFGKNALAGGINAATQDNANVESIGKGALFGGLGGQAGEALGKIPGLFGKGSNAVADLAENRASSKVLNTSGAKASDIVEHLGQTPNDALTTEFGKESDINKLLGPASDKNSGGIWKANMTAAEQQIQKQVKASGSKIVMSKNDLLQPLYEKRAALAGSIGNETKIAALDDLIKETETKYAKGATAQQALTFKRTADEVFGKSVVEDTKGAVSSQGQKVLGNAARSALKTKFPAIADALDSQSRLLTLQPVLAKSRGAALSAGKTGLTNTDTLLAAAGVLGHPGVLAAGEAAKFAGNSPTVLNAAGSALRVPGKLAGKVVSPAVQDILSKVGAATGAQIGGTPSVGQVGVDQQTNTNGVQDSVQSDTSISNDNTKVNYVTGFAPEKLGLAYTAAVMSGNTKAASQLKELYDTETSYQKAQNAQETLTPSQQVRHDNVQAALAALDGAETNLVTAGGAKGALGAAAKIPVVNQILDPQGASYNATKIELATQLAKAITGAARPGQEVIDGYVNSLPSTTDQPKYAAALLAKLRTEVLAQAKSFKYKDILAAYQ